MRAFTGFHPLQQTLRIERWYLIARSIRCFCRFVYFFCFVCLDTRRTPCGTCFSHVSPRKKLMNARQFYTWNKSNNTCSPKMKMIYNYITLYFKKRKFSIRWCTVQVSLCVGVFYLKKYWLKLCGIQLDMDIHYFLLDYIYHCKYVLIFSWSQWLQSVTPIVDRQENK